MRLGNSMSVTGSLMDYGLIRLILKRASIPLRSPLGISLLARSSGPCGVFSIICKAITRNDYCPCMRQESPSPRAHSNPRRHRFYAQQCAQYPRIIPRKFLTTNPAILLPPLGAQLQDRSPRARRICHASHVRSQRNT